MEVQLRGRYVLIKGGEQDHDAHCALAGQMDLIGPAVDAGEIEIEIIAEQWTTDRKPEVAQANTITAHGDAIDAVLSANDGMASGGVAALETAGMAGLPLSVQDGDIAAVNRIARGLQTITAWKDVGGLGAFVIQSLDTGLALLGVTRSLRRIPIGFVLIGAVWLDRVAAARR